MQRKGWMFVLPWTLEAPGGVNEVVSNLYRHAAADDDLQPHFMVLDWNAAGVVEPTRVHDLAMTKARLRVPGGRLRDVRAHLAFMAAFVGTTARLWRHLRRNRITVVNVHYPTIAALYFAFIRRFGGIERLIVSMHGHDRQAIVDASMLERRIWRYIVAGADHVVACSAAFAGTLPPHFAARTTVIHNGLDIAHCERDRLGVEPPHETTPSIVCVATIEHKKGLDVLVAAFAAIAETSAAGLRLVIVGRSTAYESRLRASIEAWDRRCPGLGARIEIVPGASHAVVLRRIESAAVFVLPSRTEPFGIVLLEAGYQGVPIVATDVGGIPEIVESGVHGLLVPADDAESLADALSAVLRDREGATRRAVAFEERVRRQFSWRHAWSRYRGLGGFP